MYYGIIICVYTSGRAMSIVAERDFFDIGLKSFCAYVGCQNYENCEVRYNGKTYMRILQ